MAKKKTGLSSTLFSGIDPYAQEEEERAEETHEAARIPLAAIRPDPNQPRRILPPDLAYELQAGNLGPQQALRAWFEREEAEEAETQASLRRLAESIARHGLINPITIRKPDPEERIPGDGSYFIVTGERRFWAQVLLATEGRRIQEGATSVGADEIRATVAAEGITIRAHQLIENIMREDINAVEKAEGLEALRFELSGVNYRSPRGRETGERTEVNDSSPQALVPWTRVSEELGISKRYRIFLTSVLKLSPEAQEIVRAANLAETTIRPIVQKLRDYPSLQVEALQQLVRWQEENAAEEGSQRAITRSVKELVEQLLARQQSSAPAAEIVEKAARAVDAEAQTRTFRRRLRGTARFLQRLPAEERVLLARDLALDRRYREVVAEMEDLHRQLDKLLGEVEAYREGG